MINEDAECKSPIKRPKQDNSQDLKNLTQYTTMHRKDDTECHAHLEKDLFQIRKIEKNERFTILSEWKFDDFIGLELHMNDKEYMDQGYASLRPIGTTFETKFCCSAPNTNRRVIKEGRLYHGDNDEVVLAVRNIIMTAFWKHLKSKNGSGVSKDDTSYIHPNYLKPWEKKAIVYINPYAGLRKSGKMFHTIERYQNAFGFVMDTVTTFRQNQVQEEMAQMEGSTFKNYYCRLVFSGDGLVNELINGFYNRKDHDELTMRICAFPGGTRNCASYYGHKSFGLDQIDPINSQWVATRMQFKPMSICKYQTNGPRSILYGFHDSCFGLFADVVMNGNKFKNQTLEENKKLTNIMLKYPVARKFKIQLQEKTDEKVDEPNINEESLWKAEEETFDALSVVLSNFPIFTPKQEFTRKLKIGDQYGVQMCAENDPFKMDESKKFLSDWFNAGFNKDDSAGSIPKVKYTEISGYRIEVLQTQGPEGIDKNRFLLDGECHIANKVQCVFLKQDKCLLACL